MVDDMMDKAPENKQGQLLAEETNFVDLRGQWQRKFDQDTALDGDEWADKADINWTGLPLAKPVPWPSDRSIAAIPLDQIAEHVLPRRTALDSEVEMRELMASLQCSGLSNPIVVQKNKDGDGYRLVQGARRLSAYRRLFVQSGDDHWSQIPAFVVLTKTRTTDLYRQVVDENLARRAFSYGEMALLAQNCLDDPAAGQTSMDQVINTIFSSASQAKRSHIASFVSLLEHLDGLVSFPEAIPRDLGLALHRQITTNPSILSDIAHDLFDWDNRSIADELDVLRAYAFSKTETKMIDADPHDRRQQAAGPAWSGLDTPLGKAAFFATKGRLELCLDFDFAHCPPEQMQAALLKFLEQVKPLSDRRQPQD